MPILSLGEPVSDLAELVSAAAAACADAATTHGASLPGLEAVAAEAAMATPRPPDKPACPSLVHDLLERSTDLTGTDADTRLLSALRSCAHELAWQAAYVDYTEPDMLDLHSGYFFAELIGQRGPTNTPVAHDSIGLFFTVQKPNLMYPSHVHKAPELYHVIAGEALWERGSSGFNAELPGAWINHPTGTRHAMATEDQPLVAMAIWTADLDSIPVIVRD